MLPPDRSKGSQSWTNRKSAKKLDATSRLVGHKPTTKAGQELGPSNRAGRKILGFTRTVLTHRFRYVPVAILLSAACFMFLYAEIARGWIEAVFLKVRKNAIHAGCEPLGANDHKLVYISCPILYMHDFRSQLPDDFAKSIAPGLSLDGLSIELRTEVYQWKEFTNCGGKLQLECKNTFEKVWSPRPLPTWEFACRLENQEGCYWPAGGQSSVANHGTIPSSLKAFKKTAERVSVGSYPAHYYLNPELIAQFPSRATPLIFSKDNLPQLPGMTTWIKGDAHDPELRVEAVPNSTEPSIGDLRTHVFMTDFYMQAVEDDERSVTIIAEQGPYINGGRQRTLIPWNSGLTSWKDGKDLRVDWLSPGKTSMDDVIAAQREDALDGVLGTISHLRAWGVVCIFVGFLVLFFPLATIWLQKREWVYWLPAIRDVFMLSSIAFVMSLGTAAMLSSLPWFYFWPLCGFILLIAAGLALAFAYLLVCRLDRWDILRASLLEWRGRLPSSQTSTIAGSLSNAESTMAPLRYGATAEA